MKSFTTPLLTTLSLLGPLHLPALAAALPWPAPRPIGPSPSPNASQFVSRAEGNTVTVPLATNASVTGYAGLVESFIGIPYALPPLGDLRLRPPQRLEVSELGNVDATAEKTMACPQFFFSSEGTDLFSTIAGTITNNMFFREITDQSEDCLTINVVRPAGTRAGDNLPVLFWIYGGGFYFGSTSSYDPSNIVTHSIDQGKPFIYVAVNYRVNGFGFMPGKEILAEGSANVGLLDQRAGLEWVADSIAAFGGDPTKVTIWGESAGAISVFDQMALYGGDNRYNGQPLFRGAIMNSGSVIPTNPIDCPKGQAVFDTIVAKAGCAGMPDVLTCLRSLDTADFQIAVNSVPGIFSYTGLALSYLPRPDGRVLIASPDELAASGIFAGVPMIVGDQEDEGTAFSLFQRNLTTRAKLVDYIADKFFHDASRDQIASLVDTYSNDIQAGSPFHTGILNEIYPGFKRLAALQGDVVFTLARRIFLASAATVKPDVPAWSYLATYDYGTPILGTYHSSDLDTIYKDSEAEFKTASIREFYTNFVTDLDPNGNGTATGSVAQIKTPGSAPWPLWGQNRTLAVFGRWELEMMPDDFRSKSAAFIAENMKVLRV